MKQFALLIFGIFFVSGTMAQKTVILKHNATQGKDAFIWQSSNLGYDNLNWGADDRMLCHAWTNSGVNDQSGLLIEYDLSGLPSGVIAKATLKLYNNPYTHSFNGEHREQSGTNESVLSRIAESWTEKSVTWSKQPKISNKNQIVVPRVTNAHADLKIDVTDMVVDMVKNPSTNFGFMLSLVNPSPYKSLVFASSDNADSTKWPELIIEFATSGINKPLLQSTNFNIFPNPANGEVSVYFDFNASENWNLKIYDEVGKEVFGRKDIDESLVPIESESWSAGVYYVSITTAGGLSFNKKLLKY